MTAPALELSIDILIILTLSWMGWTLMRLVAPDAGRLLTLALAYPLGAALYTWSLYLLSLLRVRLSGLSLAIAGCLLMVILQVLRMRRPVENRPTTAPLSFWLARGAFLAAAFAIFGLAASLSIERAYSTWDAMAIWGIKGFAIAKEGTIFAAAAWGAQGLAYPLNIPLQIASFRLFSADLLPGSKLIFPIYFLSMVLGFYWTLGRREQNWRAGLAALVLASVPFIFQHATQGYANLPFTFYLVLATATAVSWAREPNPGLLRLTGLLMAGAAWTRAEGLYLVPMILLGIWVARKILGGHRLPWKWLLGPFLVVEITWQPIAAMNVSTATFLRAVPEALAGWGHLDFHLSAFYWIARYTARQGIDPTVWGVTLPVVLVLWLLAKNRLSPRSHAEAFVFLLAAVAVGLWSVGYFYLSSYPFDVKYLLGTSVNRLFMPFWVLLLASGLSLGVRPSENSLGQSTS